MVDLSSLSFCPYKVLNLPASSLESPQVAKLARLSFLKLALKYHPDKNPDDPAANQKFMDLSKAYKTLTDETARSNYEKYGNPDGPGSFKVAIALPKFLMEKDFQVQVLLAFFVFLLVLMPAFFLSQLSDQSTEYGVQISNKRVFFELFHDKMTAKDIPGLLANAMEFRDQYIPSPDERKVMQQMFKYDDME